MHSKNDHWCKVGDLNQEIDTTSNTKNEDFQTILPISMKISAQTLGTDLVSVAPMGGGSTSVTYNINAVDAASFKQMLAQDPSFI